MALYTNIAGFKQVGLVQDAYFVRPAEGDYSQDGYFPSGGYYEPVEAITPVPISTEFPTGGLYTLQPATTAEPEPGTVFYDPGFVQPYTPPVALPANDLTTYQERESVPVTPILQIDPGVTQSPVEVAIPPAPVTTDQVQTTVTPPAEKPKNYFPLVTLALLYVTMVKGESLLGGRKKIAFAAGLGALYLQMKQPA